MYDRLVHMMMSGTFAAHTVRYNALRPVALLSAYRKAVAAMQMEAAR